MKIKKDEAIKLAFGYVMAIANMEDLIFEIKHNTTPDSELMTLLQQDMIGMELPTNNIGAKILKEKIVTTDELLEIWSKEGYELEEVYFFDDTDEFKDCLAKVQEIIDEFDILPYLDIEIELEK